MHSGHRSIPLTLVLAVAAVAAQWPRAAEAACGKHYASTGCTGVGNAANQCCAFENLVCTSGTCTCKSGYVYPGTGTACVACGAAGQPCCTGSMCTAPNTCGGGGTANVCGVCTAETDAAFCARLGKSCGAVTANDNCGTARTVASCGTCTAPQTCGAVTANVCGCVGGTACSGDGDCCSGFACQASVCVPCGGLGNACCAGSTCLGSGLVCGGGNTCIACGADGQPCCPGSPQCVGASVACVSGTCRGPCHVDGQSCSASPECCSDFKCVNTKCCTPEGRTCCGNYCDDTYSCAANAGPGIHHFLPETLVIPMDDTQNNILESYGFVYRLLEEGIAVSWVINPSKTATSAPDFSLSPARSVQSYDWATGAFAATTVSRGDYVGGPFVITGGDVIKVKRILDPARTPAWKYRSCFAGTVQIDSLPVAFDAPVYRTMSKPPGKFALHDARGGMLEKELSQGFGSGAGCAPDATGVFDLISDEATIQSESGAYLINHQYAGFWTSKVKSYGSATVQAVSRFVDAGGLVFAQSDSVGALDNDAAGRFVSTGGLDDVNAAGKCSPTAYNLAADPVMQLGFSDFKPQGGYSCWEPDSSSAWRGYTSHFIQAGASDVFDGVQKDNDPAKGWVFYMGGHSSIGGSANHVAAKRIIMNVLLRMAAVIRTVNTDRVVARSAPVVEETSASSGLLYQGTMKVNCNLRTTWGGGAGCAFDFPLVKGAAPVVNLGVLGTATTPTTIDFTTVAGSPAFDPAGKIAGQLEANTRPTASHPKRWIFTGVGSGSSWTRTNFIADGTEDRSATLATAIGLAAADAASLIASVRAGGFGGVDHATPAIVEPHLLTNNTRPTVAYVASLDGMLHAICADQAAGTCVVNGSTFELGEELWAFLPPSQLGRLKSNTQGLDSSPRVEDLSDTFYGATTPTWKTVLVFGEGAYGRHVYALDVTDPGDPIIIWQASPNPSGGVQMGSSQGAVLGMAAGAPSRALAWASSNIDGGRGVAVYALRARDGAVEWSFYSNYGQRKYPGVSVDTPNDIPAPPAVAPSLATGALNRLFVGDFEGRIWQLDAATGANLNGSGPLYTTSAAGQPFGAPLAIWRDIETKHLMVVAGTGGADWTLAGSLGDQFEVHIVDSTDGSVRSIGAPTIPMGQRVYAQPVVRGQELFVASSSAPMYDRLDCNSDLGVGAGTGFRINLESTSTSVVSFTTGSTTGFDVGSKSGTVFAGGLRGETRAPSTVTASGADVTTANIQETPLTGRASLWLQRQ